jgi:competence protein ComGC
MTSNLLQSIGLGGLDIAYVLIGMLVLILVLLVLVIIQFSRLNKLQKRYIKFMKGKDAKSLEQDIAGLYDENEHIRQESERNRKDIKEIQKRMEYCYQKLGIVKYDAFSQMGGQLSFCLALLNEKDDGFILNSVQSSEGCYTYTKEVKKGECAITLGEEEKKALDQAMGY